MSTQSDATSGRTPTSENDARMTDEPPSFAPHRTPPAADVLRVVAHREAANHRAGEVCPDCPDFSGRVAPRCAHCRREQAECQAGVASRELHAHGFSPTAKGNWFDCPFCETPPASQATGHAP